jgi:hypothetical protein
MDAGVSFFLYRIYPNGTHRAPSGRTTPEGQRYRTQLAVDLHFLLTAWAKDASLQHTIAGWMMRILEDTPSLPTGLLNHKIPNVFHLDETMEEAPEEPQPQPLFLQRQATDEMSEEEGEEEPEQSQLQPLLIQRQGTDERKDTEAEKPTAATQDELVQPCGCSGTCSCGQAGDAGQSQPEQQPSGERPRQAVIQTESSAVGNGAGPSANPDSVSQAIHQRGSGEPLNPAFLQMMEMSTGVDFNSVRVHRDGAAHAAARALQARAFTHGSDIWLGSNESPDDRRLMAHEAAHVVQQGAAPRLVPAAHAAVPAALAPALSGKEARPKSSSALIQRQNNPAELGLNTIYLSAVFKGQLIEYTLEADAQTMELFTSQPELYGSVENLLSQIFTPPTGPLMETPQFLASHSVRQLIQRDLRELGQAGRLTMSHLAAFLGDRARILAQQQLLSGVRSLVQARLGIDPASLDWNVVLPALQARLPKEPHTAVEASVFDRYATVLTLLANEVRGMEPVVGAQMPDLDALEETLIYRLPTEAFGEEMIRLHSEKFLARWLIEIASIRYVPEGFDIEAFRPGSHEAEINAERNRLVRQFMDEQSGHLVTMFVLDEWTRSGSAPEDWLARLDINDFREQLVDHLSDRFLAQVREDDRLLGALRVRAVEEARFNYLRLIYLLALGREREGQSLMLRLTRTPLEELSEEELAVANDPAGFTALSDELATVTQGLLSSVRPGENIQVELLNWARGVIAALEVPSEYVGLLLTFELVSYLQAITDLVEEQRRRAREAIREAIDLDFPRIAEIIRHWADLAEQFIEQQWKPMLKQVAIERITTNRDELQQIYDNWDIANEELILRLTEGADEFELLASRLEDGSYESIEMSGQVITRDDVSQLQNTAQFLRDEANLRRDPERSEEKKEELREAIDVYETVKADIEGDEYDPLDYSKSVYEEARRRLGISEFPEYTTVGMVLRGDVSASQNPFLARAIVAWKWKEGVERTIETGLLLGALLILSVAAMLVPGVGGLVLGALDIGIGIGLGVKQIADAYELLNMGPP